jgi:hypothetical protein
MMVSHVTRDPQAKVDRANEHLASLARLIDTFAADAYVVDMYPAFWLEKSTTGGGDVVIVAQALLEPPSNPWGPIIGDIVNGLRSALDHLIWSLSLEHQALWPSSKPDSEG